MLSLRRRASRSDGFTLIELILTVGIMMVIIVALTGVLLAYFKNTKATSARLTESSSVEFVAAYWQRDVSSIGVRGTTYDQSTHSFPVKPSVSVSTPATVTLSDGSQQTLASGSAGACGTAVAAAGTNVVTLSWNEYASTAPTAPNLVTVTYALSASGQTLTRIRCHYVASTSSWVADSSTTLSSHITGTPIVSCDSASCSGVSGLPNLITLKISVFDSINGQSGPQQYGVLLTGERRQS